MEQTAGSPNSRLVGALAIMSCSAPVGVGCRFGRGVAQLGSAPASGAGGPGFKSRRPDSSRSAEGRLGWRGTGVWPAARLTARGFSTNPGAPTQDPYEGP